jgi:rhodanese-related sulfurtransferase
MCASTTNGSSDTHKYLAYIGYDAVNVSGGMVAWQRVGRPLVADGDHQAKIY